MSTSKKLHTGLGKGLGALIPSVEFSDKGFKFKPEETTEGNFALIDTSKIQFNPYQPRKEFDPKALEELKNSIKEQGVIQPITVRRAPDGYELISGERRTRATIAAGLNKIPAYILDNVSDVQMLEIALIENVQRENLNPIEIASGYHQLIEECNLTQEQVAHKVGKDRSTVTNFLRLLRLPEKVQDSLRKKVISMGHARALVAMNSVDEIEKAWNRIVTQNLSVRATEAMVRDMESGKFTEGESQKQNGSAARRTNGKETVSPETALILEDNEKLLRQIYATQVKITPKNESQGTIEFEFYSIDEFERLVDIFSSVKPEKF